MLNMKNLTWEDIYPVGSIYMSVNSINPSNLFGGTWTQIKDTFLLACGDTFANGSGGGSITHTPEGTLSGGSVGNHTLTVAEMPSHRHDIGVLVAMISSTSAFTINDKSFDGIAGADNFSSTVNATGLTQAQRDRIGANTGGGGAHNHPFTQPTFTGTEQDTMPPYLAVYMWQRIA